MFYLYSLLFLPSILAAVVDDTTVLLTLKAATNDPFGMLHSWNTTTDTCQWEGVSCSSQGQVSNLTLQLVEFSTPPVIVFSLNGIRGLSIFKSNFTLPLENVTLKSNSTCQLEFLIISNNHLGGGIPTNLLKKCNNLRKLDLSHNQLTGTILPSIFQSCKLVSLDLSSNWLSGMVPQELVTKCRVLQEITLAYNNFSGEFPALDTQSRIQKLKLASNSFTRVRINSCFSLTELDVSCNRLGEHALFSASVGTCSSLKFLNISSSTLSGSFSNLVNLESLPSLVTLDGSYNHFTGEVPSFHAELHFLNLSSNDFENTRTSLCSGHPTSKLRSVVLPNNKLTGPVLSSVLNCTSLEMLDLSFNFITGEIPKDLCDKLPSLQHLLVWKNSLEGRVPSSLSHCMNLSTVILSYNRLQGIIPPEISLVKNLWWLSLSSNQLTGTIPPSFGKLQTVEILQIANNSLEGEIPVELANCQNLVMLDLSGNLLSGHVPPRIGRNYTRPVRPLVNNILGNCYLVVEVSFSKCKGRETIFLLQGFHVELLVELFQQRAPICQWQIYPLAPSKSPVTIASLVTCDLSYNRLTGHIPGAGLSTMQSLVALDLAHNMLDGPIPSELGELRALLIMDLSENMLSGRIPDSLAKLTFLHNLNVSYNNLSGLIPQTGQFNTFPASNFQDNPGLYGFPLPDKRQGDRHRDITKNDGADGGQGNIPVFVGIATFLISFLISCGMVLFCDCGRKVIVNIVYR